MNKEIKNHNSKGHLHGYQQSYVNYSLTKLWYRCMYKHGQPIGYQEWHGSEETEFYIK